MTLTERCQGSCEVQRGIRSRPGSGHVGGGGAPVNWATAPGGPAPALQPSPSGRTSRRTRNPRSPGWRLRPEYIRFVFPNALAAANLEVARGRAVAISFEEINIKSDFPLSERNLFLNDTMSFLIVICKAWDLRAGPSSSLCSPTPHSDYFALPRLRINASCPGASPGDTQALPGAKADNKTPNQGEVP